MSKRSWERVTDPSEFRQGWEVEFRTTTGVVKQTARFKEPFDPAKLTGTIYDGYLFNGFNSRVWFQRPPKAMKEPKALHSMVQVNGRQFILADTTEPESSGINRWREVTDYKAGVGSGWSAWRSILNLGTPTPYTPEVPNE